MRLRRGVALLAGAALALVVSYSVWYRVSLHNWPWQGDPPRLPLCGHDYYADNSKTIGLGLFLRFDLQRPLFYPVYRTVPFIGQQVYSTLTPAERARTSRGGRGCGGELIIKDSATVIQEYGTS